MTTNKKEWILITGASEGLGKQLSISLVKKNQNLILLARKEAKLKKIADFLYKNGAKNVEILVLDLKKINKTSFGKIIGKFKIKEIYFNAAVNLNGLTFDTSIKKVRQCFDTNFFSNIVILNTIFNKNNFQDLDKCIFILSGLSIKSLPNFGIYAATKSALYSYVEALKLELKKKDVKVFSVFPGTMDTNFDQNAIIAHNVKTFQIKKKNPSVIAEKIIYNVSRNNTTIILDKKPFILFLLTILMPSLLERVIIKKFLK